jgi:hypothetical protein
MGKNSESDIANFLIIYEESFNLLKHSLIEIAEMTDLCIEQGLLGHGYKTIVTFLFLVHCFLFSFQDPNESTFQ